MIRERGWGKAAVSWLNRHKEQQLKLLAVGATLQQGWARSASGGTQEEQGCSVYNNYNKNDLGEIEGF